MMIFNSFDSSYFAKFSHFFGDGRGRIRSLFGPSLNIAYRAVILDVDEKLNFIWAFGRPIQNYRKVWAVGLPQHFLPELFFVCFDLDLKFQLDLLQKSSSETLLDLNYIANFPISIIWMYSKVLHLRLQEKKKKRHFISGVTQYIIIP